MRKLLVLPFALFLAVWFFSPVRVSAQTGTPPPPSGRVTGKIINQNQGRVVDESLEVMLHVWDKDYADINMLHGQSGADGTYTFTEVELEPQYQYGVMAIFEGVTYMSQILPPREGSDSLELDVEVYETTKDTSVILVNQVHVIFNFAGDGLETTEIYALSNPGMRTIKDAVSLEDGTPATLRYPLPEDADYIFFRPDEDGRYIKFPGGYADTSPLLPGGQAHQHAVTYLTPYSKERVYRYVSPYQIKTMSFLLPEGSGVSLRGEELSEPQNATLGDGVSYQVYSFSDISAGQTIQVTLSGEPNLGDTPSKNSSFPIALGAGLLGLALIAAGWWWRRSETGTDDEEQELENAETDSTTGFDDLIGQIARLDTAHEGGELNENEYVQERARLRAKARDLLRRQDQ